MRAENSLAVALWPKKIRIHLVLKTKSRATIPTFCFVGICACLGLTTGSVSGALDDFQVCRVQVRRAPGLPREEARPIGVDIQSRRPRHSIQRSCVDFPETNRRAKGHILAPFLRLFFPIMPKSDEVLEASELLCGGNAVRLKRSDGFCDNSRLLGTYGRSFPFFPSHRQHRLAPIYDVSACHATKLARAFVAS